MIAHTFNNLQEEELDKKRAFLTTDRLLQLIILPTEQCNFRCIYCYEDFSIGHMNSETVSAIKMLLKKRSKTLRHLQISWFGGEPLVAKRIVMEICDYAAHLAQNIPDFHYSSQMTTNAYLLDIDTANVLVKLGVCDYQISLDGSRDTHDRSRVRVDGKGTFDTIWRNLIAIRDSSLAIKISLRIHFTAHTFYELDSLIEDIKKEFLSDSRFCFYFIAIKHHGGINDSSIDVVSTEEEMRIVNMLEFKLFGDNSNSPNNLSRLKDESLVCYASKANSLLIRANGNIGKCTVALSDERNNIGTIQSDGTLKLNANRFAPWVRGIETMDPETLGCPLVSLPTSEDTRVGKGNF
jgi:uncharacterized protein